MFFFYVGGFLFLIELVLLNSESSIAYLIFSVGNIAANRRRQQAVTVGKERREALVRTKRLCRDGIVNDDVDYSSDKEMMIDEEQTALDTQTSQAVEELKSALRYQYVFFSFS